MVHMIWMFSIVCRARQSFETWNRFLSAVWDSSELNFTIITSKFIWFFKGKKFKSKKFKNKIWDKNNQYHKTILRMWPTIWSRDFRRNRQFTISRLNWVVFIFRIRGVNHLPLSGLDYRLAQKMARQLVWVEQ